VPVGWFSLAGHLVGGSSQDNGLLYRSGDWRKKLSRLDLKPIPAPSPNTAADQRKAERVHQNHPAGMAYVIRLPEHRIERNRGYPAISGIYNSSSAHMASRLASRLSNASSGCDRLIDLVRKGHILAICVVPLHSGRSPASSKTWRLTVGCFDTGYRDSPPKSTVRINKREEKPRPDSARFG